MALIINHWIH